MRCAHKSVFYIRNFTIIVCELRTFLPLFAPAFGTLFRVCVRCVSFLQHCSASFKFENTILQCIRKFEGKFYRQLPASTCAVLVLFSSGLFCAYTHTHMFYNRAIITSDAIFRFRFGLGFWLWILSKESCTTATTIHYHNRIRCIQWKKKEASNIN